MSFNPPKEQTVSEEDFEAAIERAEARLELTGQPRAIVFHEKKGRNGEVRRHAHAVWCRIDTENMRAIQLSHTRQKMQSLARELYVEHDWQMPQGFVSKEFSNPRNYSLAEWQQAKRAHRDPDKLKAMFQECWATSDGQASLAHALRERGFVLARGDRRGVVAVDHNGEVYALARWVGVKTKQVRQRVSDTDKLPNVRSAHRQAAKPVTDRLKVLRRDVATTARNDLSVFSSLAQNLKESHLKAVQDLVSKQKQRAEEDARRREARFRGGFRGLLDRFTGVHKKTKLWNERERLAAENRDSAEKATLEYEHQLSTEVVQRYKSKAYQSADTQLTELREDFREITARAENNTGCVHNLPRGKRRRFRQLRGP